VLDRGRHGPGAAALVRGEDSDMFGLGAREAVLAALTGRDDGTRSAFGAPVPADTLAASLTALPGGADVRVEDGTVTVRLSGDERDRGAGEARALAAAYALGWRVYPPGDRPEGAVVLRFSADTP
jgi:coenzyme F420-0:L-glutamate ligase/coenzyme F420-1:gamma-L-glutamate ligase